MKKMLLCVLTFAFLFVGVAMAEDGVQENSNPFVQLKNFRKAGMSVVLYGVDVKILYAFLLGADGLDSAIEKKNIDYSMIAYGGTCFSFIEYLKEIETVKKESRPVEDYRYRIDIIDNGEIILQMYFVPGLFGQLTIRDGKNLDTYDCTFKGHSASIAEIFIGKVIACTKF